MSVNFPVAAELHGSSVLNPFYDNVQQYMIIHVGRMDGLFDSEWAWNQTVLGPLSL